MKFRYVAMALLLSSPAFASDASMNSGVGLGETEMVRSINAGKELFEKVCVKKFNEINCLNFAQNAGARFQYVVGIFYEKGFMDASRDSNGMITHLGAPNYIEARKWFTQAAANGDDGSAYRLAEMDKRGWMSANK
jgi:hypothetical protein